MPAMQTPAVSPHQPTQDLHDAVRQHGWLPKVFRGCGGVMLYSPSYIRALRVIASQDEPLRVVAVFKQLDDDRERQVSIGWAVRAIRGEQSWD